MTTNRILVDCSRCDGCGQVGTQHTVDTWTSHDCGACDGTGQVEATCRDCDEPATVLSADCRPRCSECHAVIAAEARILLDHIASRSVEDSVERICRGALRIASSIAPRSL